MGYADEATNAGVIEPVGRDRSNWGRVALVSTLLSALVYLILTFAYAQSGHPTGSGYAAVWVSAFWTWVVVFAIVGRRYKLRGRGNWIRAAVLPVAIIFIYGGVLLFFLAMAGYH